MNIDEIIFSLQFIPLLWFLLLDEETSNKRKVFLKFVLISIVILVFGIVYENYITEPKNSLVYFGSQVTFTFIVLYKIIQIPYYWIFKRRPEILSVPKRNIDIIPSLIVIIGSVILPIVIDRFIIQKFM
ncbi:MAG: hypothetical protein AB8B65_20245 [Kordia sp.]|uniref:hypothetical protein n=1 Tax=Kordia sp. TaxID=1965332 RepID=UPI00385E0EC8